jgi:hypothetical protein
MRRELVETQQMFERNVMSLRKFFSALGLPGCCWRRGMQLNLVCELGAAHAGRLRKTACAAGSVFFTASLIVHEVWAAPPTCAGLGAAG